MGFPSVAAALGGLGTAIEYFVVTKTAVDYEVTELPVETVWLRGVLQPLPVRELKIKREGQRTWNKWTLWTEECLDIDAILQDTKGVQYRVLSVQDWSSYGYKEYELVQQPQ